MSVSFSGFIINFYAIVLSENVILTLHYSINGITLEILKIHFLKKYHLRLVFTF